EVVAPDDGRLQFFRTRANLRTLDAALGAFAVVQVVEDVRKVAGEFVAVLLVAAGFHDPIDDVEPEAEVVRAGLLVEEAAGLDAPDVPLLLDRRFERVTDDVDAIAVFSDLERGFRRRGRDAGERDECECDGGEVAQHGDAPEVAAGRAGSYHHRVPATVV